MDLVAGFAIDDLVVGLGLLKGMLGMFGGLNIPTSPEPDIALLVGLGRVEVEAADPLLLLPYEAVTGVTPVPTAEPTADADTKLDPGLAIAVDCTDWAGTVW